MKYAIGIDIGGTNTRVALINENYEIKGKSPVFKQMRMTQIRQWIR